MGVRRSADGCAVVERDARGEPPRPQPDVFVSPGDRRFSRSTAATEREHRAAEGDVTARGPAKRALGHYAGHALPSTAGGVCLRGIFCRRVVIYSRGPFFSRVAATQNYYAPAGTKYYSTPDVIPAVKKANSVFSSAMTAISMFQYRALSFAFNDFNFVSRRPMEASPLTADSEGIS